MSELWSKKKLYNLCTIRTGDKDVNQGSENGEYSFFTCAQKIYKIDDFGFDGEAILIAGNGFFNVKYYVGKFDAYQRTYVLMNFQADGKFLFHYIKYHLNDITSDSRGSTIKYIRIGDLQNYLIPLPPTIKEQQQIVERLEARLEKLSIARQRLEKIPLMLKRFRQSVLASACNGKLTAGWREGKDLQEWKEATILNIVKPRGQLFDGPFGSNLKSSDYVQAGVRVVRLENVGKLSFIEEKETFVTEEKYQSLQKHEVFENDIIFSSFIADGVRVCLVPNLSSKAIAKADCFCIRPNKDKALNKFICFALSNPEIYHEFSQMLHGATRPRINTTQLKTIEINLPPLPEQEEIVRRVDKFFAISDSIEQRYRDVSTKLAKAEKALYAKAFRGEL